MADAAASAGAPAAAATEDNAATSTGKQGVSEEGASSSSTATTASLLDAAANDDGDDADSDADGADDSKKAAVAAGGAGGAAGGAEEEDKGGAKAFLRGKLKPTEEGVVVFIGAWASAKADFADKTKTSKLRYETSLTKDQLRRGDVGDTSWDGYFLINEGLDEAGKPKFSKIKEEGIELAAEAGASADLISVKGSGVNNIGAFKLTGVFNKATRQMMLTKQYEADDDDDDMEEDTRTAEEIADELALLAEEATMDISALKSGAHLRKRKASGAGGAGANGAGAVPVKRERRQSAMRAQNRWRDKLQAEAAGGGGGAGGGAGGDALQALTDRIKALRKEGGGAAKMMPVLRKLDDVKMTVAALTRTKVGSVVNKLVKKHDDVEVKRVAARLVKKWREAAAKETDGS